MNQSSSVKQISSSYLLKLVHLKLHRRKFILESTLNLQARLSLFSISSLWHLLFGLMKLRKKATQPWNWDSVFKDTNYKQLDLKTHGHLQTHYLGNHNVFHNPEIIPLSEINFIFILNYLFAFGFFSLIYFLIFNWNNFKLKIRKTFFLEMHWNHIEQTFASVCMINN